MSFGNLQVKSIKSPSGIYKSNLSRPLQESTKVYPSSRNQVINLLPVSSYPCLTSLCYFCCFQFFCCSGACLGGTVPCRVNKAPLTRIILLCSSFYGNSAPIFQETNCVSNCVIFLIPLPLGRPHSIFEGSPSVCCIFMCQSNDKAANTWDFFNEYTGVNELDCPWGLYEHLQRVCTESKLSAKSPLLHQGVKPGTVPCQTDAQSVELHPCTAELN